MCSRIIRKSQKFPKNTVEVIYLNVNEKGDVDIQAITAALKSSDKKTFSQFNACQ